MRIQKNKDRTSDIYSRCLAVQWCCRYIIILALWLVPQTLTSLHGYSFQYQNVLLLNIQAGLTNLATRDANETPDNFLFATEFGLSRYAFMPQGSIELFFILRNYYLLRFQVVLNNLRNQQSNVAFGLGNETKGLLFGVAQEFTLASESRPNLLGLGTYIKAFYNSQGSVDLQLEGIFLTNTLDNTNTSGYQNIYAYIHSLFMSSQLRWGIVGMFHFWNAVATGPILVQMQGNLVFGGSAPARLFLLDFYFSSMVVLNQSRSETNYSALFLGAGVQLHFVLYRRFVVGLFFEAMPFGIILEKLVNIDKDSTGFTLGLSFSFRFSRKELWKPEIFRPMTRQTFRYGTRTFPPRVS